MFGGILLEKIVLSNGLIQAIPKITKPPKIIKRRTFRFKVIHRSVENILTAISPQNTMSAEIYMTVFETQLQKLGLAEKEVAIYLTLLSHGPCSVRKLAGISGVNRGTTYDVLKSLKERGLVSFYHEDTKQHFVAEDPIKLKQLVGDRQSELEMLASNLKEMIPELRSLHDSGGGKPVVRYYEGPPGVRTVLLDVLDTMQESDDDEYYAYSSASVREAGLYASFPDYTTDRIDRGINVKTISLGPGGTTAGLDARKWINAEEGAPTYILIYAGKVAYISLGPNEALIGIIVENSGLFQTQKLLFEHQWNLLN